jgi:tRNA(Ile)-lysidine synthetase-like protein
MKDFTLEKLYNLWFSNELWWFQANEEDDTYLKSIFEDNIDVVSKLNQQEFTKKDLIGYILFYDQLPRHVFRHQPTHHILYHFLQKAFEQTLKIQNSVYYYSLNANEWSFVMLPFRHTNQSSIIHEVMKECWQKYWESSDSGESMKYKRFLRATYERCPYEQIKFIRHIPFKVYKYEWDSQLYKTLLFFAPEKKITRDLQTVQNESIQKIFDSFEYMKNKRVIISLSGGVDSMICSYIMSNISRTHKIKLMAVHIDYWNRPECREEEEFLQDWCSFLNIPLYVRRITEIQRKPCMDADIREVYETYTRNVRYNTYKAVWNDTTSTPCVILGHNKDDCIENCLTNIAHQTKYNELTGMTNDSVIDGIQFMRPLLGIYKQEIQDFSKMYNIPHFANSTPPWSMRGKIRDIVKPALNEWNKEGMNGLIHLSEVLHDLHETLNFYIDEIEQTRNNNNGLWKYNDINQIPFTCIFWKTYIEKIYGIQYVPSMKSLKNFIERFNEWKLNSNRKPLFQSNLSKNVYIKCTINNQEYILTLIMIGSISVLNKNI